MSTTNDPTNTQPAAMKRVNRREALKIGTGLGTATFSIPAILSACGGTNSLVSSSTPQAAATGDKILNVYWNAGHTYTTYKDVIAQFTKDTGYQVKLAPYQWPDLRTKLLANFAANDVPDLVEQPGAWVQEFARAGNLLSLQSYVDKDKQSTGFPDDWQSYTVDGNTVNNEIYGVPLHLTCNLPFYNKDLFAKAGISSFPTNWDDFLAAAKELTGNGVYGFAMNQDSGYSWPWYLQNKVHLYDAEKKVLTLDNDAAYEALQFQYDLIYKYKVAPVPLNTGSYDGPQKLFTAGRAAIILSGPWDIKPIFTGNPNLNWDVAQALTHQKQSTYTAGSGVFIPKGAKNPAMAWELIKRLTTLQTELAATKEARMTMPRKSWGSSDQVKQTSLIAAFGQGLNYAENDDALVKNVATAKVSQINSLFDLAFQNVIYKQASPSQTLKDFVAAGNKILAQ